jgi:hypothetical protein
LSAFFVIVANADDGVDVKVSWVVLKLPWQAEIVIKDVSPT